MVVFLLSLPDIKAFIPVLHLTTVVYVVEWYWYIVDTE